MALIVTIADPTGTAPIYDGLVTQMHTNGWLTQDLQVKKQTATGKYSDGAIPTDGAPIFA